MLIAFLNQITAQLTECFHSKSDNILQHMFWMKPKFQTTRVFLCDLTFSTPGLAFHVYLMNLFEPLIIYLKILVATVFFCHFSYIRQTLSLLFCLFYLLFSGFSLFLLLIIKCLFLILFSTIFFFFAISLCCSIIALKPTNYYELTFYNSLGQLCKCDNFTTGKRSWYSLKNWIKPGTIVCGMKSKQDLNVHQITLYNEAKNKFITSNEIMTISGAQRI